MLEEPVLNYVIVSDLKKCEFNQIVQVNVTKSVVDLWWPNGYGNQTLYSLVATWRSENRDASTNSIVNVPSIYSASSKTVQLGFRTIEVVEDSLDAGKSFYFKVNGLPIFMKGTNWIPSHILPEHSFDAERVQSLLWAVKNAHMNMIRVWGGGIYETDTFYNLADELGILIWQDMMFACAMYPAFDGFLE